MNKELISFVVKSLLENSIGKTIQQNLQTNFEKIIINDNGEDMEIKQK